MLLGAAPFACGAPQGSGCPLESWSGVCGLTSFTKVREVELPVPHAVYEAIYTPVQNSTSQNYTPASVRLEVKALSKHEFALQEHMQRHAQVSCHQTIKEGCSYNEVVATLPEFNPDSYQASAEPTGPQGCAKIETQGMDGAAQIGARGSESLPERFFFAKDSSNPDETFASIAQSVAQKVTGDPSIECIGVVGQSAAGESPGLGELRAQAVKRLLIQHGVPTQKMMTISASTPLYGAGNEPQPTKPEDQRVSISIILRAQSAAPGRQ